MVTELDIVKLYINHLRDKLKSTFKRRWVTIVGISDQIGPYFLVDDNIVNVENGYVVITNRKMRRFNLADPDVDDKIIAALRRNRIY